MSNKQREKGKRGERACAAELREALPELAADIMRGWQARLGSDAPDVLLPGYWLEVKSGRQPNPRQALRQAIEASNGRGTPLACIRDDRREPFAVIRWRDLTSLVGQLMRSGEVERLLAARVLELEARVSAKEQAA